MADPKDSSSFFRKVVRFVANPATDWNDLAGPRPDDGQELERSELRAMVERKRRNDFVRKREFDTLRKLRRDGLSPEQLAALGGSSKVVDDSEARLSESSLVRADAGVKAKIDEIEQQMVGEGAPPLDGSGSRRPAAPAPGIPEPLRRERTAAAAARSPALRPDFADAPTQPLTLPPDDAADGDPTDGAPEAGRPAGAAGEGLPPPGRQGAARGAAPPGPGRPGSLHASGHDGGHTGAHTNGHASASGFPPLDAPVSDTRPSRAETDLALPPIDPLATLNPAPVGQGGRAAHGAAANGLSPGADEPAMEVSELVHDPELDEAVIAFANADYLNCESALEQLRRPGGPRHAHAETWLVLFDLYRATGLQLKFESLALEYAGLFGRSAPQWFSLPKLVADAAALDRPSPAGGQQTVGWTCPPTLDTEAVATLRETTAQLPLPWVLDWRNLQQVSTGAAVALAMQLRDWAPQRLEMRWLGTEVLLQTLADAAPTGQRSAEPAYWMARLEALRLINRADQFDEAAIDYCVTYEVSPPSWEHAQCQVRVRNDSPTQPSTASGEASSFAETAGEDMLPTLPIATVELGGQQVGDIAETLKLLDRRIGQAPLVQVSCTRLIRVDFIAAGDLLNWVMAKNAEHRSITFVNAHRLVALFFGAMGINEHAKVQVPRL